MNTGLFFFSFFFSSNRIYWAHYQAAYEVIWNEATLKHSTNPLYLVILTLYLNSEHRYGITAAAPHPWVYYLTGCLESATTPELPIKDISSNFLNHQNNLSERTRYNLGCGSLASSKKVSAACVSLGGTSHVNQAAKDRRRMYVCILRKIDRQASKQPRHWTPWTLLVQL